MVSSDAAPPRPASKSRRSTRRCWSAGRNTGSKAVIGSGGIGPPDGHAPANLLVSLLMVDPKAHSLSRLAENLRLAQRHVEGSLRETVSIAGRTSKIERAVKRGHPRLPLVCGAADRRSKSAAPYRQPLHSADLGEGTSVRRRGSASSTFILQIVDRSLSWTCRFEDRMHQGAA